jgi:hypothetical protein
MTTGNTRSSDIDNPPRVRFRIHWWGWAFFAICALYLWGESSSAGAHTGKRLGGIFFVGEILLLILAVAVALITFLLIRRSQIIATIVFSLVIWAGFCGLFLLFENEKNKPQERFTRHEIPSSTMETKLLQDIQDLNQSVRDKMNSGNFTATQSADSAAQVASILEKASGAYPENASMRALQAITKIAGESVREYAAAYGAVNDKSPMDPTWVKDRDDLKQCFTQLDTLQAVCDRLRRDHETFVSRYENELIRFGVKPGIRASDVQSFELLIDRQSPTVKKLRDADDGMIAALRKQAALLDREWGKWSLNDNGDVVFQNPQIKIEFDNNLADYDQWFQQQEDAQKEFGKLSSPPPPGSSK